MKIQKDKAIYPIDFNLGLLHSARLLWEGRHYPIEQICMGDFPENEEKTTGIPTFFAYFPVFPSKFIKLYPIPDRDAEMAIRYYPPLQEY